MDIARIIREGREKLNLNQSQLAALVGVSPQAVQQWESGATQPRGKRLNKIAEVLRLAPAATHFIPAGERRGRKGTAVTGAGATVADQDPLIAQVVEAMRRMSKEDAARLVTISKALIGEGADKAVEIDLKPLPVPDMAAHPAPAFPPRRMSEGRTKTRRKTAIR
ncbi:MAG: helix-turn-helix transcriptional regulator [Nitrosospira sp.]|nr:helix-turn-helix transcriptional regulator [Nitrosospira sp.]